MNDDFINGIAGQGIKVALMIASPMLLGALIVGMTVSVFQAVTQINEQTLSFIPKILAIGGALVIFAPWMSEVLTNFTSELIINIPAIKSGR